MAHRRHGRRYWRRRAREAETAYAVYERLIDGLLARLWRLEGMMEASEDATTYREEPQ